MDNVFALLSSTSSSQNLDRADLNLNYGQEILTIHHRKSIIINLKNILNSRKGSVQHLPDFGIPDLSNIYNNMPESIHVLVSDISLLIEKYEPRLKNVVINVLNIDMKCVICLEIFAYINKNIKLSFQAKFYPDGKARIE